MTEKSPDAYRTISEAGEEAGLPAHVLRFWESKFTQLKPVKRAGGRRLYRPQDVQLLKGLRRLLYEEGYTIKGAQKYLKDHGVAHVSALGEGAAPADVPGARTTNALAQIDHEAAFDDTYPETAGSVTRAGASPAHAKPEYEPGASADTRDALTSDDRARIQSALNRLRAAKQALGTVLQSRV
jgi:DNA-binding transcriptional MerR regulator